MRRPPHRPAADCRCLGTAALISPSWRVGDAPPAGPTVRSLRTSLLVLGLALALVAYVELSLLAQSDVAPFWVLALFVLGGALWVGTGLLAWSRRPSNRTGLLLVAAGGSSLAAALGNTAERPLVAVGALVGSLPLALALHVLLAFPSGRTQGGPARTAVVAGYLIALLGPLPALLFAPGSPITVADVPGVARLSAPAAVCGRLLLIAVAVLLVLRLRDAGPVRRRSLGPLYAYGAAALLAVSFAAQLQDLFEISDVQRFVAQICALAVIPVASSPDSRRWSTPGPRA